jgi:hypothetical protein
MKEKYFFKTSENLIGCVLEDDTFLLAQQNGIKRYDAVEHCPSTVFLPPQNIIDEFFPRKNCVGTKSFVKNIQKHPQCNGLVTIALKGEGDKGLYLNSGPVVKSVNITTVETLKDIWDNIDWYRITEAAYKALKDMFWNENIKRSAPDCRGEK